MDDDSQYQLHPYHYSRDGDDTIYRQRSASTSTNHSYWGNSDQPRGASMSLTLPPPHMPFSEGPYRHGGSPGSMVTPPISSLGTPPYANGRNGEMEGYFPFSPTSKPQDTSGPPGRTYPSPDSDRLIPSSPSNRYTPLPPHRTSLSPVGHLPPRHRRPSGSGGPIHTYDVRSDVDQKALGAFRVAL